MRFPLALLPVLVACGEAAPRSVNTEGTGSTESSDGTHHGPGTGSVSTDESTQDEGSSTISRTEGGSSTASEETTGSPDLPADPGKGPPYPIVLAHGFFGFDTFAGLDFVTYFYGVRDRLAQDGEVLVFTPAVDPFDDSTDRGSQLLAAVESILAETGHAKVNLIGHSQGGLDARVVAHLRPDRVASVTTFSTPHGGSAIADIVLGLVPNDHAEEVVDEIMILLGEALWGEIDENTSLVDSLGQLSTASMITFNERYTDAPGVLYLSYAGRSARHLGGSDCAVDDAPPFIADFVDVRDGTDTLLAASAAVLSWADDGSLTAVPNDGLVRVKDARWGEFRGCVPADHIDEVGHLFGDSPGIGNPWQHDAFYAALVADLRARGL